MNLSKGLRGLSGANSAASLINLSAENWLITGRAT